MIRGLGLSSLSLLIMLNVAVASSDTEITQTKGNGKVQLVQYHNGHWQMLVEGKPYFIKGVVYEPVKVGERLTLANSWMNYDFNANGKPDTAYDSWVDKKRE